MWLTRAAWLLVASLVLAAVLGALLLRNLDAPWVKAQVQTLVQRQLGVEVEYQGATLEGAHALHITGLRVATPLELRALAPTLLSVQALHIAFSASGLANGRPLQAASLHGVALTVVREQNGRTSFDALADVLPGPQERATLSQLAEQLVSLSRPLRAFRVDGLSVRLVHAQRGVLVGEQRIDGLSLNLAAPPGQPLHLVAGRADAPLRLAMHYSGHGRDQHAALRFWLNAQLSEKKGEAALGVHVVRQDLAPHVGTAAPLEARLEARFDQPERRTILMVHQLRSAGTLEARGQLELPDGRPAVLRVADGELNVGGLVRWLPPELLPLQVARGQLQLHVRDLVLGAPQPETVVQLEGELQEAALSKTDLTLRADTAWVRLDVKPFGDGLSASGQVSLSKLQLAGGAGQALAVQDASLTLSGARQPDGALTGELAAQVSGLTSQGSGTLSAREGSMQLRAQVRPSKPHHPLPWSGEASLGLNLTGVTSRVALAGRADALRVELHASAAEGDASLALRGDVRAPRLRVAAGDGQPLFEGPVALSLQKGVLTPNLEEVGNSQGSGQLSVESVPCQATLALRKERNVLTYTLQAQASPLTLLLPLLPSALANDAPWSKMSAQLHSTGRLALQRAGAPLLQQRAQLELSNPTWRALSARALHVALDTTGTLHTFRAQGQLRVEHLTVDQVPLSSSALDLSMLRDAQHLTVQASLQSQGAPKLALSADARLELTSGQLEYRVDTQLGELAALEALLAPLPFLQGLEPSRVTLTIESQGSVQGVAAAGARGALRFLPGGWSGLTAQGSTRVEASQLRWAQGQHGVSIPSAHFEARWSHSAGRRSIDSQLTARQVELSLAGRRLTLSGLRDRTSLQMEGDLVGGTLVHAQDVSIDALRQRFAPLYPVGQLRIQLRARRSPEGVIQLHSLQLTNQQGGTRLSARGSLELGRDQRRLSLSTRLDQALSQVSKRAEQLSATGRLSMEMQVASPDFRLFHTKAKLRLENASLQLPEQRIALTNMHGEIPIVSDWALDRDGFELLRGGRINPYATQRFADQHPLMSEHSFLSVGKIETPWMSVAPFAANLTVQRNLLSLSQVELGVRGGTVTGNGILAWDGLDSKLEANVRATGVQSTRGEPFDGNAALLISFRDHSIEGRADILRIGRRHLLDLLDLQDPRRADASLNDVRGALRFGYPDRVRLSFQHGFARAGVTFGGLARLLRVRDVRGIPIGPMVERIVSSLRMAEEP